MMDEKKITNIGIHFVAAILFFCALFAAGTYQREFHGAEKELGIAQANNIELGEQLAISLDRVGELEGINHELEETTDRIAGHNQRAISFLAGSLTETETAVQIIDRIEKGIAEIEASLYIAYGWQ